MTRQKDQDPWQNPSPHWGLAASAGLFVTLPAETANAYTITITSGTRAIYLQVGAGGYTGFYNSGGTPGNNATVNVVSVAVPAASVGSGAAQAMTSNSTVSLSPIDGFAFCNPPSQVYIGAWSRPGSGTGVATLTVTTPSSLTNGTGSVPFSQISWVMSGNGDSVFQFPNGTFYWRDTDSCNLSSEQLEGTMHDFFLCQHRRSRSRYLYRTCDLHASLP